MDKVAKGMYVELIYDLYKIEDDGTEELVHQVDEEDPEGVIYGITQGMVVPLERALEGLAVGEEFDVVATADEAYGQRSNDFIVSLDKELFEVDGKFDPEMVHVGASLPMIDANGFRIEGVVTAVGTDTVTMDFNHPLTGKSVRLSGHVSLVRPATDEEIKFATSPSCGGCCGGDSECGGGSCGSCHCN